MQADFRDKDSTHYLQDFHQQDEIPKDCKDGTQRKYRFEYVFFDFLLT